MSLENPPHIPYELVKELADLLARALKDRGDKRWRLEAELAVEEYKDRVALNG